MLKFHPLFKRVLILIVVLLLLTPLSWQCIEFPSEPVIPTWDVPLSFPIIHRTYTLLDLIEMNPDVLDTLDDGSGQVVFLFSDSLREDELGDRLRMEPQSTEVTVELGTFSIDPDPYDIEVDLSNLIPPGYSGPWGGFPSTPMNGITPPNQMFEYALLESGSTILEVTNNSGVPVEIPNGITLRNADDNEVLGTFEFSGVIEHGESQLSVINLAGKRIYKQLTYEFNISSPPRDNVTIPADPSLELNLNFENLLVSEAYAIIPEQEVSIYESIEFTVDDSIKIRKVTFLEGGLNLVLENAMPLNVDMSLTLNEMRHRENPNEKFTVDRVMSGHQTVTVPVDMSEWMIVSQSGLPIDYVTLTVEVKQIGSGGAYVYITSSDYVRGKVDTHPPPGNELIIELFEGVLPPTPYEVEEITELPWGDFAKKFSGDISFEDARLVVGLFMEADFPSDLDVIIEGSNAKGGRAALEIPEEERRLEAGEWKEIVFDKESGLNEFLDAFLPHLPEEIGLKGDILIAPEYPTDGSVEHTDALSAYIIFEFPLKLGIRDGLFIDTVGIGDNGIDRDLLNMVNYGKIYFESTNHIPLGFDIRLELVDESGNQLRLIPGEDKEGIGVPAAEVGSDGRVIGPTETDVRMIELTTEDTEHFKDADVGVVRFGMETSEETEHVKFLSTDYIIIKIYASFNLKVDF